MTTFKRRSFAAFPRNDHLMVVRQEKVVIRETAKQARYDHLTTETTSPSVVLIILWCSIIGSRWSWWSETAPRISAT